MSELSVGKLFPNVVAYRGYLISMEAAVDPKYFRLLKKEIDRRIEGFNRMPLPLYALPRRRDGS